MLSKRTLGSLAQFLELYDTSFVIVLFSKHGLRLTVEGEALLLAVNSALRNQRDSAAVLALLEEVVRTQGCLPLPEPGLPLPAWAVRGRNDPSWQGTGTEHVLVCRQALLWCARGNLNRHAGVEMPSVGYECR